MNNDDYFVLNSMLKASPHTDGKNRFIYMEASNESLDLQNEIITCKALKETADYFLKFGNIDIDHITMLGAKSGTDDYQLFEVGRPVDVNFKGSSTFVKAQLFDGKGRVADKANYMWETMTQVNPPVNWFPSVGGAILQKAAVINPDTGQHVNVATKVRWSNIGMSRTPVNPELGVASVSPIHGVLLKSLGAISIDSGLIAGYGSDMNDLSGGSALRVQSLSGVIFPEIDDYYSFRELLSNDIMEGKIKTGCYDVDSLGVYAKNQLGLDLSLAQHWVNRYLKDLNTGLKTE